ncbi:hypothetical protein TNCV_179691 [Trichonephila clavipes]|nr:hypothetical protein TNCV_179691 [Trichonephila clavipes]
MANHRLPTLSMKARAFFKRDVLAERNEDQGGYLHRRRQLILIVSAFNAQSLVAHAGDMESDNILMNSDYMLDCKVNSFRAYSRYGIPVLKPLTPQLVSVQSARRFFSFAFRIPGQHHRAKLWDSPLLFLQRSALLFSELFSSTSPFRPPPLFFLFRVSSKRTPFKHQGCVHNTPLAPSYSQVTKVSLDLLLLPIGTYHAKTHPSCLAQGAIVPCPSRHLFLVFHSQNPRKDNMIILRWLRLLSMGRRLYFTIMATRLSDFTP